MIPLQLLLYVRRATCDGQSQANINFKENKNGKELMCYTF